MGERIADRPYEAFSGQRVAGLSQNEQAASEMARTGFGSATDYFKRGASALSGIGSWADADRSKYMNPYMEEVVNRQQRDVGRGFDTRRADLQRTAGMRSAFGGGRQAALESGLEGKFLETTGDISAQGYATAYDRAMDQFNQEQQRRIAEAGAFGSLGAGEAGVAGQAIGALSSTGQAERQVDQLGKDFDYMQFIERRDWDVNNLQPLLASIQGAKHGQTTTSKEKTSGGGLSALAGMAATVGGAMMGGPAGAMLMGKMMGGGAAAGGAVSSLAEATSLGGMVDSLSGSWTNAAFGGGGP
jgi:hypothetical protein